MRTPHTSCKSGTRVEIKLKNDTIITGKFHERTGRFVKLADGRSIVAGDIRSMRIYRGPSRFLP